MGWLEQNDKVTFPNATIRVGAADWDHFAVKGLGGRRRARRLAVVESRVELIERDGELNLASRTRADLLREADEPNTALLPCHFPAMTATRLVGANGTKQWQYA